MEGVKGEGERYWEITRRNGIRRRRGTWKERRGRKSEGKSERKRERGCERKGKGEIDR